MSGLEDPPHIGTPLLIYCVRTSNEKWVFRFDLKAFLLRMRIFVQWVMPIL